MALKTHDINYIFEVFFSILKNVEISIKLAKSTAKLRLFIKKRFNSVFEILGFSKYVARIFRESPSCGTLPQKKGGPGGEGSATKRT